MDNNVKVSDSEEMVLSVIWDADHELDVSEIIEIIKSRYAKVWAPQTISTFLLRLRKKGFLEMRRNGRNVYYVSIKSKEAYRKKMVKTLVERFYGGDYQQLIDEAREGNGLE